MTGGAGALGPAYHPQSDFFVCDIFAASPKDDLASMEHPMFSLSTRPDRRILDYTHNGAQITVTPSVKGLATIHDKDILIYCISQLVAALNAGRTISRTLHLTAHDLLVATNRETSAVTAIVACVEAFERSGGHAHHHQPGTPARHEVTTGFGLIETWQIARKTRGGRMV